MSDPSDTHMNDATPASSIDGAGVGMVYGSLEHSLRAAGVSAAVSAAAEEQAEKARAAVNAATNKTNLSFNQRTTLLSDANIMTDVAASSSKQVTDAVKAGMAAGNINISAASAETFALSEAGQKAKAEQLAVLREMEVKKRARSMVVPTNDNLVRKRLRELGEPITLFGERIPGRRERLSGLLARKAVEESMAIAAAAAAAGLAPNEPLTLANLAAGSSSFLATGIVPTNLPSTTSAAALTQEKENKAYLTPGTEELRQARVFITSYSLAAARERLAKEQKDYAVYSAPPGNADRIKSQELKQHKIRQVGKLVNFSSEVGDQRPIASLGFSNDSRRLATASWSGLVKIWDLIPSTKLTWELKGHKEPVTDVMWNPKAIPNQPSSSSNMQLASCGMDGQVLLWPAPEASESAAAAQQEKMEDVGSSLAAKPPSAVAARTVAPLSTLSGHADRCCRLAFHPSGRFIGSTSFDKTWRLWDVETQKELLKQQGHMKPTYAIAFQRDGALAATGDLGGVGQLWDLRTGKTLLALVGHAKQMLAADFHPTLPYLATASDDHTVRVWDLRKQSTLYTIGAHSNLISNVRWEPIDGSLLLTSSYDQTSKIWHGTDFTLLKTLAGHEGRVMRAEFAPNGAFIATSAYDRTWKLFAHED